MVKNFEFDIALSFAGEDRVYVDQVASLLVQEGVKVFYDKFEQETLWGKNLYDYLSEIYKDKAHFTIMFISESYKCKLWTNHERQAMQARAFQENIEYILPARFDDTEIPGIFPTIGYISLKDKTPTDFVDIVIKKLVNSGVTIPSKIIRKSFSSVVKLPPLKASKSRLNILDSFREPIANMTVVAIADNNTTLNALSDSNGIAEIQYKTRRVYNLLIAHKDYPSTLILDYDIGNDLEITIQSSENIGSMICIDGTGYISGFRGRINPILDSSNRTYIYASNIAINGGKQQPVHFKCNEIMEMEDCDGVIMQVSIKFIKGETSLIEYIKPVYQSEID